MKSDGNYAMWYVDELQDWMIGPIEEVGTAKGALTSYGNKKTICPSNVKNLWEYWNGYSWILSSDIKITDIHANPSKSKFLCATVLIKPF